MDVIYYLLIVVIIAVCSICIIAIVNKGFERHEIWECETWAQQEKQFSGFYWTDWMSQQCRKHIKVVK